MRVMLDTNILISMIFFPSKQTQRLVQSLAEHHRILLCDYVIDELRLVVQRKFPAQQKAIEQFFMNLPFELIHTPNDDDTVALPKMRDKADEPILHAAITGGTDVLLTGDKDFHALKIASPLILTMADFQAMF